MSQNHYRLGLIKQSPRQASIDDIEWLCEEVERLEAALRKADAQLCASSDLTDIGPTLDALETIREAL